MKHKHIFIMTVFLVCLCCAVLLSCGPNGKFSGKFKSSFEETFDKESSYALGLDIGTALKSSNLYPNMDEFLQAIMDVLTESETRYTMDEAGMMLQQAFMAMNEKRELESREVENAFLAENSKKPGIHITDSGLQYEVITEGNGPKPEAFDTVTVHYEGSLTDGTVFDSSYTAGEPIDISLMRVIPGWTEGLQLMAVGSKYRFFIPSDIGYGSQGGGQIPPYSTLIFEVELLDIIKED
jgi:FKBP-type peptidyl-prolyl cis-trans isomerase